MLNPELQLRDDIFLKDVELKSTREGYGDGILEAAEKDTNIVCLVADLKNSTKLGEFEKKYPKRFFQVGIAEQNMAGIACGLALSGKIPFISSFASFNPGRNWEQIRVSIAYSNTNVKIVGSHAGLSASSDGASAQALEDIATMRVLPDMIVIHPIDYEQTVKAVLKITKHKGPVYLRIARENLPCITSKDTPFEIGRAYKLVNGDALTLLTTGPLTIEALKAANELTTKHKIDIEVIACPTIKPLDEKEILKSVKKTKKVITLEEHQIAGGFGSAVCEFLSREYPIHVLRLGVDNSFGESGTYKQLLEKHGLTGNQITKKVLSLLQK